MFCGMRIDRSRLCVDKTVLCSRKNGYIVTKKRVENRVENKVGKSAGRKPLSSSVREARVSMRDLLEQELQTGHRANGPDRTPWTKAAFHRALDVDEDTAKDWYRKENPAPPRRFARKILVLFYGDKPDHAERRAAMRAAMLAAGIEHDELDDTLQIDLQVMHSAQHIAERPELTRFSVYQPARANDSPRLIVPFELGIRRDNRKRVPSKDRKTTVALEIGLTMARFAIESRHWRPAQESIFGPAGPRPKPSGMTVTRNGPAGTLDIEADPPGGLIQGDPFEGIYNIPLEPMQPDADGPATFLVKAPEEAVAISVPGSSKLGEDKKADLLRILFGQLTGRDARAHEWFVLEREEVAPAPRKDSKE